MAEEERRRFGLRDFLGAVNLKDFIQMVGAELGHIGRSLGLAPQALPRRPFGPLVFVLALAIVVLRLLLLALVVLAFGTAILAITLVRALGRLSGVRRSREHDGGPEE